MESDFLELYGSKIGLIRKKSTIRRVIIFIIAQMYSPLMRSDEIIVITEEERPGYAISDFRRGGVSCGEDNVCVGDAPPKRKLDVCVTHQAV